MFKKVLKYVTIAFTLGTIVVSGYQVKAETATGQSETTYESEVPTVTPKVEESEVSSKPEESIEPEVTSKPEESMEPDITSKPEESMEPEVTSKPEESMEPEVTSKPEESKEPEVSVAPSESSLLSEYQGIVDIGNTTANDAAYMSVNTYIFGQMKEAAEQRWYLASAPAGKLTVYLTYQAESDIDLDLFLFKYNVEDGTISQVASSSCSDILESKVEQLSYICDEGYYFIAVSSSTGFDLNNKFTLLLLSSGKYDNKEADDAIEQRQIINGIPVSIEQTIDNVFDVDWVQFTVPKNKNIFGVFRNESEECTYIMTLYDSNLNKLGTIAQGQNFDGLFTAGYYFVKIESITGSNPDVPYSLTFTPYDNFNTRIKASGFGNIQDSIENERDENWIEYTLNEAGKILFTLTNPSSKVQCVIDVCTMGSDGTINIGATITQGNPKYISLQPGVYYIRVRSVSGYDPNTKYTLNIDKYIPNLLGQYGSYTVTTNDARNGIYINGKEVDLTYRYDFYYDAAGRHEKCVKTFSSSTLERWGEIMYEGKRCICVEMNHAHYYEWLYRGMVYNGPVKMAQFVIDLETGTVIYASVVEGYDIVYGSDAQYIEEPNFEHNNAERSSNLLGQYGTYKVTTDDARNGIYINGKEVDLTYIYDFYYDAAGRHEKCVKTFSSSTLERWGEIMYEGKRCICVEMNHAHYYEWLYRGMVYNGPVKMAQFVIDLETGTVIYASVVEGYDII